MSARTLPLVLAAALSGCESNAPAAPPRPSRSSATEWLGALAQAAPASSPLPPRPQSAAVGDQPPATWVLHVGDSFVAAWFEQNLAPRFRAAGARQVALAKTATYTTTWASDADLDRWLARRPALVLITLGANEVDNTIPELHGGAIHRTARKAAAVAPCVWISPPMWKEDLPGWIQTLHDHSSPCLFFESDAVLGGLSADERRGDGIHPNQRGGARWAEAFWGWLEAHRAPDKGAWALRPYELRTNQSGPP